MSQAAIQVYPLPPQLLTSPYLDQLYQPMAELGITVHRISPRRAIPALLAGHGERILHLHFFDELTQRRSWVMTALRSSALLLLLSLLRWRGVRIIWTAHNLQPHETYHAGWAFRTYRGVLRRCDGLIVHSAAARMALEARYGQLPHSAVIPHGSYIGLYGAPRERQASRAALGLPTEGKVLLCLGTLRPYKQIEALLDAFAQLPEAIRGTLLIAGSAKFPEYLELLLDRASAIPGVILRPTFIPDPELPTYLAAADLVVLPYRSLLTSGMLLWALSYARPVLAPAFGPVTELIEDGKQGFLFAADEPHGLHKALQRALEAPNLDAMGASGLRVAEKFRWPQIAAQTAAFYREICDQGC